MVSNITGRRKIEERKMKEGKIEKRERGRKRKKEGERERKSKFI